MALNFVPGVNEVTIPLTTGIGVGRALIGEDLYQRSRNNMNWGASIAHGFIPFNPVTWPIRIAIIIIFVLLFIIVVDLDVGRAFVGAFFVQAIMVTIATHWFMDKFMTYGFGV